MGKILKKLENGSPDLTHRLLVLKEFCGALLPSQTVGRRQKCLPSSLQADEEHLEHLQSKWHKQLRHFFFFSFIWAVFYTNENQALGVMLFCVYNKTSLTQTLLIYNL